MLGEGDKDKTMEYLKDLEGNAEKIITNQRDTINLNRVKEDNRVGIRHLMKTQDSKSWLAMGNILFRFNTSDAKKCLEDEQVKLEKTLEDLRKDTKLKVHRLREIEGKPELKGYNLKPLESDELKAIYKTLEK